MAGFLDKPRAEALDLEAQAIVDQGVEYAEASPDPDIDTLTEFVYA